MATESMKTLREGIAAWNRRDYEGALENISDEAVWKTGAQFPGIAEVYEGKSGVREFFRAFSDPWDEISVEIEEVIEDREDQIFCVVRFRATGREGIEVDSPFFQIYRYDDEHQVVWFQALPEDGEEEARRVAAELS